MTVRRRLAAQDGMSIVEILAAILIIVFVLLGGLQVLHAATKGAHGAQRRAQAIALAERELELLRRTDYDALRLTALPAATGTGLRPDEPAQHNPREPGAFVSGGNLLVKANFNDARSSALAGTPASGEPLVHGPAPDGTAPAVEPVAERRAGETRARVFRFVTDRTDAGTASKRLVVAVVIEDRGAGKGLARPVWLSTAVTDPEAGPLGVDGLNVSLAQHAKASDLKTQSFFLSDTPCGGADVPAAPTSHPTRDTGRDGATCDGPPEHRPDLLSPAAPAVSAGMPDYSSDVPREDPAGGLVMVPAPADGCPPSYAPAAAAALRQSTHRWATPRLGNAAAPFRLPAAGRLALVLPTQTADGLTSPGRLCVFLAREGDPRTNLIAPAQAVVALDPWPADPVQHAVEQALATQQELVLQGERLLLTLTVLPSAVGAPLALLYDHAEHPARITLATPTPLGG